MRLITEWNKLDTSQFTTTTPAFASASNSVAVSVVTSTTYPYGNLLRFDGSSAVTTGTRAVVVLATAPLEIENGGPVLFRLGLSTISANYGGISFFGSVVAGNYYGYNYLPGGVAGWRSRIDNGVLVSTGSTGDQLVGNATEAYLEILVDGIKAPSIRPRFALSGSSRRAASTPLGAHLRQNQWFSEPAVGWTGLAANRWGFCLQAGGGATLGTMDLYHWSVWDPLADGGSDDETGPLVTFSP